MLPVTGREDLDRSVSPGWDRVRDGHLANVFEPVVSRWWWDGHHEIGGNV